MGEFVVRHMCAVLHEDVSLSLSAVRELLETASLAIASPDTLLTILMECRDALKGAVTGNEPDTVEYFLRNMFGIVLDHCAEASENQDSRALTWILKPVAGVGEEVSLVTSQRRLDAPRLARLGVGDHVCFVARTEAVDSHTSNPTTFDALVQAVSDNEVKFRCLCQPPVSLDKTAFEMKSCVPFVTAQTTGEALVNLLVNQDECCALSQVLTNEKNTRASMPTAGPEVSLQSTDLITGLNESQSRAVSVAIGNSLTCLWGPPGTGKDHHYHLFITGTNQARQGGKDFGDCSDT